MINIKIKKEKLNSKWYRFLGNTIFAIILVFVELFLSLGVGSFTSWFSEKVPVSSSFIQFKTYGDWVLAGFTLLSLVIGVILVTKMYEYSNTNMDYYSFKKFLLGNIGAMMITTSILGFFGEFTSFPNSGITVKAIKNMSVWAEVNYGVSYLLIAVTVVLMIVASKKWIEQNNWYIIGVFAGPIVYVHSLLIAHRDWESFITAKTTTFTLLAKMFRQAKHAGLNSINIALMNRSAYVALFGSWFCLALLVLIGGAIFVIQQKERLWNKLEEKAV